MGRNLFRKQTVMKRLKTFALLTGLFCLFTFPLYAEELIEENQLAEEPGLENEELPPLQEETEEETENECLESETPETNQVSLYPLIEAYKDRPEVEPTVVTSVFI